MDCACDRLTGTRARSIMPFGDAAAAEACIASYRDVCPSPRLGLQQPFDQALGPNSIQTTKWHETFRRKQQFK